MITNASLTLYHKTMKENHKEHFEKYEISKVWIYETKSSTRQQGYARNNKAVIRIPYHNNRNINIENFKIGDIVCNGIIEKNIESENELNGLEKYTIVSITNNYIGNNPHIHLVVE